MRIAATKDALKVTALAMAFCLDFQCTKHWSWLSAVNPFGEDPWDSVASAAVQLVLFLILLLWLRVLQPRPAAASQTQSALRLRGSLMVFAAVGFTCLTDLLAMARHRPMWTGRPAGYALLAMTLCLLVWSVLAAAHHLRAGRILARSHFRPFRLLAVPAATLVLALYPEVLRERLVSEVFAVLCGMTLLFLVVWAIGTNIPLTPNSGYPDVFDDFAGLWSWSTQKLTIPRRFARSSENQLPGPARAVCSWLSPRRHRWNLPLVAGALLGAFLVAQELAQPGGSPRGAHALLVIAVYVGLESAMVLTGYALLADPLHLFRHQD